MKTNNNSYISEKTIHLLKNTAQTVKNQSLESQRRKISEDSPYSEQINPSITYYEELCFYVSLQLQEASITRPALIREIDLDLFVTHEGKTNRDLMESGQSPYLCDEKDSIIELHHIGQAFHAPFAELTKEEHIKSGYGNLLHPTKHDSWRNNPELLTQFNTEKAAYWKQRAFEHISFENKPSQKLNTHTFSPSEETSKEIVQTLEQLFQESSIEDLQYISSLANNYVLQKQIGATSIEEFILNIRETDTQDYPIQCPYCNSTNYVIHGTYTSGTDHFQRYLCNSCGKTFRIINDAIISGSQLSFIDWLKLIDCLYNGFSVRKTASICNLSPKAVNDNRLRLFYALYLMDRRTVLKGKVVIDETYFPLSYKGNHSKQENFQMPRKAHKRGRENNIPGTSKNTVCVVCALDEEGNSIARIASLGSPTARKLDAAIGDAILSEHVTCIYSDEESALKTYAKNKNIPIKQAKLIKKNKKYASNQSRTAEAYKINRYLQSINSYHSRLKRFLRNFGGTSSELLSGYLYLFAWKDRYRDKEPIEAYRELLSIMTKNNLYKSIENIQNSRIFLTPEQIEANNQHSFFKDPERAAQIFALWAKGVSQAEIGRRFHISASAVSQIITKCYQVGLGYQTDRERKAALIRRELASERKAKVYRKTLVRNTEIYEAKQSWKGPVNEFYSTMAEKYNLSIYAVKNIIIIMQRINALKEPITLGEEYTFPTLFERRVDALCRFVNYWHPEASDAELYRVVAAETGYSPKTLWRLFHDESFDKIERRESSIAHRDIAERDKQIFKERLNFSGTDIEFYEYASQKYNTSKKNVRLILKYCYMADISRYDMIHD